MSGVLLDAAKFIGAPGSLTMLAVTCVGCLLVLRAAPSWRRSTKLLFLSVCAAYAILGLPVTANAIAAQLPSTTTLGADRARQTQILNVLDGDNRRGRVAEALRIYRLAQPQFVFVSGQEWLEHSLLQQGIPRARLQRTETAANTRAQVAEAADLVRRNPWAQMTIVASRLQMPRVAALARANGLNVALAPSPVDIEPRTEGLGIFMPRYVALRVSRDALYELAALRYYEHEGWIGRPAAIASRAER